MADSPRQLDPSSAAIAAAQQAVAGSRGSFESYLHLGNVLLDARRSDAAIAAYRHAIGLAPGAAEAYFGLGNALYQRRSHDLAIEAFGQCLRLAPDYAPALVNLGNALKDVGLLDEGLQCFRQSYDISPTPAAADNLLYVPHFHPGFDAAMIVAAHREWNRRHVAPLVKFIPPHRIDRSPQRRLRIGYISPDFRDHPAILLVLPLFKNHDRGGFDIYLYSDTSAPDGMTQEARATAAFWRETYGLSHAQVAELVRQDQIDIFVDLTLHMGGNRMPVFARKPAPIQVTYLGYPSTTGLQTIDYRISDPFLDPQAAGGKPTPIEQAYTELTVCLPGPWWCYDPITDQPPVNALPAAANGYVTFGCLNNFCKLNPPHLAVWAQIMQQVAGSRLLLLAPQGQARQRVTQFLVERGIEDRRVEFTDVKPRAAYLENYHRIDLCLDTFPYNGHTTTLDATWMGVPTVSLRGPTAVSRGGLTILSHLGHPEWVASSMQQYVQMAVGLALDQGRLSELRRSLRDRMRQSPLMDGGAFARNLEGIYRKMWKVWCGLAWEEGAVVESERFFS
jgi:protein O-GlcNAc transferase